jgi:hypothetical protein
MTVINSLLKLEQNNVYYAHFSYILTKANGYVARNRNSDLAILQYLLARHRHLHFHTDNHWPLSECAVTYKNAVGR